MRIDIGANSIRPELMLNKSNVDAFELKNRGENVRGKVIDVNQNIVLIQTSSGKEFLANTVVPMENFIGEEMSFVVVVGSEGQIILKPELDDKKQALLSELKIEDILNKLNKPITPENKEIVKNMIQSGIAIHEESFQEIKTLNLAMQIMQRIPKEQMTAEKQTLPLDLLMRMEDTVEEFSSLSSRETPALSKEVSLKDIITLKGLKLEVNLQNLRALHEVNQALASKDTDLLGLRKMMTEHFGIRIGSHISEEVSGEKGWTEALSSNTQESFVALTKEGLPKIDSSMLDHTQTQRSFEPTEGANNQEESKNTLLLTRESADAKGGETVQKGSTDTLSSPENVKIGWTDKQMPDFGLDSRTSPERADEFKISKEMLKELLIEITKASSKNITERKEKIVHERVDGEETLKLDVDRLSKDLKMVLNNVSRESEIGRTIEREILPKADILKEFMREFQVNILPFQVDSYENIVQYYVKRNKGKKKGGEGINVAFSLDTLHHGNVRALLNYRNAKVISVEILAENEKYEQRFKRSLDQLREILHGLGYTNISLSTGIIREPLKSIAEDKIYPNYEAKSFETWV